MHGSSLPSGVYKPLLVYRPITLRKEWDSAARNPDPAAYAAIFAELRDKFFVVSIADLAPGVEWIVGQEQDADVKLHKGELCFEELAGLFAEADLVMSPAGFAPVLAQAVGTPSIVVYGRRESFKTTDAAGVHLAPTLGIDPDESCDCHSLAHNCKKCRTDAPKKITLPPVIARLREFVAEFVPSAAIISSTTNEAAKVIAPPPRILIFATVYEDCADRANLTDHWINVHGAINPDCDLLLVDSQSPWAPSIPTRHGDLITHPHSPGLRAPRMFYSFPDNVGHLARKGRDGWGRAFCYGLQAAIDGRYDYVAHIEGDSLLRLPVRPIIDQMIAEKIDCASTPVTGMRIPGSERGWVETGLMFFRVDYLQESKFIEQYAWEKRSQSPTPEVVVRNILGDHLRMMPWKAWRKDKNQFTHKNILSFDLDWVTHCHDDVWCYDRFAEAALSDGGSEASAGSNPAASHSIKVNFGCGTNKLPGWDNHDADVDITKPLPYADGSVAFILCEHCMEHVPYRDAVRFLQECHRILAPGGVVRIAVPSIVNIWRNGGEDYFRFASKWANGDASRRGAMTAIAFAHGHHTVWDSAVLEATLYLAGFDGTRICKPGQSDIPELLNIEGHAKVIGEKFNDLETIVCEGVK